LGQDTEASDPVGRRQVLTRLLFVGLSPALAASFPALGSSFPASAGAGPPPFQGERRPFTQVAPPYPAPITPMYTAKGGVTNLRKYRGKVVLLNFWATWCPSCLYELPALDRLQKELGGTDFEVLTLNVDETEAIKAGRYFDRLNITHLPLLYDPAGRAPKAFKVYDGLPWNFIIDRQGSVQGYLMGSADWHSEDARRLLAYYLN